MERVAFLLEETGERLSCLLNPENLVVKRRAGIRPRRSAGGYLSAQTDSDDSLIYTGGGSTSLELDLVFDVTLAGASIQSRDVRDHTRPLWNLAENVPPTEERRQPPLCRFIWGKSWNILCVVVSVAERFDYFDADGVPRRSWLRMRLMRVGEPESFPPEPPTLLEEALAVETAAPGPAAQSTGAI